MKKLLFAVSLSLLATTAFAADAIVEEAVVDVAPIFSWTGGYVGAQAGYLWGDGRLEDGAAFNEPDPDGFIGGLYAGYNFQMQNNVVIGAEVDVVYADVDGTGQTIVGGVPIDQFVDQELNWSGAVRGRLGYALDRFLPYVAGGVAFGDIDATVHTLGFPDASESASYVGWTIGGGLEYAFTDNLIGRAEYRYTDFGSETLDGDVVADMELETNEVRFGIAYKF